MTLHRSLNTLAAVVILATALPATAAPALPDTTRKVIYQKTDAGNRLVTVEAPVPRPGAGQVLVHMRAIALNGGDIENLDAKRDRNGMIAASDGAGEVVALAAASPSSCERCCSCASTNSVAASASASWRDSSVICQA